MGKTAIDKDPQVCEYRIEKGSVVENERDIVASSLYILCQMIATLILFGSHFCYAFYETDDTKTLVKNDISLAQ